MTSVSRLKVKKIGNAFFRQFYRLEESFVYQIGSIGALSITVYEGFITDFASVPKWADDWLGFDPVNNVAKAALVHDYLYAEGIVSRRMADLIFREALMISGASFFKRNIMYLAVRLFGGSRFNKQE